MLAILEEKFEDAKGVIRKHKYYDKFANLGLF
jgi:uncharacterized lipoprotein YehR (DUF1307 family)